MKVFVRLMLGAAILAALQTLALAQGARRGFTATDLDDPGSGGNFVYKIDLNNPGNTAKMGTTGVNQELEGFFSIGNRLYGVAETPDITSTGDPSNLVDLTPAAVSATGVGVEIGLTGIDFGTEAGSAYDKNLRFTAFSIASDDRTTSYNGQAYPATALFTIDASTGSASGPLSIAAGRYLDGLAVGGDGTVYASDCRLTDSLYKYNFDTNTWDLVGSFGVSLNEDSGLANYYGVGGSETNLYLITEGDGANLGRLWTVSASTGTLSPVNSPAGNNNITLPDGTEVPEDLEGFEIPWSALAGE